MRAILISVLTDDSVEGIDLGALLKREVSGVVSVVSRTGPKGDPNYFDREQQ